ncbi:MAG: dihydropteroate synthase [Gammaproteobacteria bacterium]|nr:dihydropteroate synthase [Gammaproteobacteria bacterium]|tara:strand:+ start:1421 stop:2215 length:795 start_codon:yes stop_codon:yes gene_type:complete
MAILNITPDSFFDGGIFYTDRLRIDRVLKYAESCLSAGSSILDVGGESSRPGASAISVTEELERVIPVIEALRARFDAVISVDSSTPEVMLESAAAGAKIINDIRSLQQHGALEAALETGLPVCLMHMQGTPETMQKKPIYTDVVSEVLSWLILRVDACLKAGFTTNQLALDPGFGFGKTLEHNVTLFRGLVRFVQTGYPILVGVSRKTMIGEITGRPIEQRTTGSAMAAAIAASYGAAILRVHDVAETRDAVMMIQTLTQGMQ